MKHLRNLCAAVSTAALMFYGGESAAQASPVTESGSAALGSAIASLGTSGRVLMIAAHPDDEDTGLIAWLSKGRHIEAAYLSLTRGDGGQNLIGNELGEALGIIRTQELLAARRIDGGKQFFTRAYDFGFSKDAEETLKHWPRDTILGDIVRVVRAFRPQVVVAFFSGTPRDGHGHHQVSGILAREAYDLSADTVRFPVQAFGEPWVVSKFYRSARQNPSAATLRINVGEYDPLSGRSYAEIAGASRSQHKSQGFGAAEPLGVVWSYLLREHSRVNADSPANGERSIFDGVDTTWSRFAHLTGNRSLAGVLDSAAIAFQDARRLFRAESPSAVVESLARAVRFARRALDVVEDEMPARGKTGARLPAGQSLVELGDALRVTVRRAEQALLLASGVRLDALAEREELPVRLSTRKGVNDSLPVRVTLYNRGRTPVKVFGVAVGQGVRSTMVASAGNTDVSGMVVLPDSQTTVTRTALAHTAAGSWWRAKGRMGDWFAQPISLEDELSTESATEIVAAAELEISGVRVRYEVPVMRRTVDAVKGQQETALAAVDGISVGLESDIEYIRANTPVERDIRVNVRSAYNSDVAVRVVLELPRGLEADSAERTVSLTANSGTATIVFRVRGMMVPGNGAIQAVAHFGSTADSAGYHTIAYAHIPRQHMYTPSVTSLSSVDLSVPAGLRVGYVAGVGDHGIEALTQLGVAVDRLEPAQLGTVDLAKYQTIVVGPRAYDAQKELVPNNRYLLEYMQEGGNLVVQYGQYEMLQAGIMPYPIQLSRPASRVTVEEAPVHVLDSASPLLTYPNRIGAGDFEGWVQERSTYMPTTADAHYATVLGMNDPGEPQNPNSLLTASVGRGRYVYVTLALFRQLPAGVPGGARILLNLITPPAGNSGPATGGR